jgi:hypothetical protein
MADICLDTRDPSPGMRAATLEELRTDFLRRRRGCLSLPIAGYVVWHLAALATSWFRLGTGT